MKQLFVTLAIMLLFPHNLMAFKWGTCSANPMELTTGVYQSGYTSSYQARYGSAIVPTSPGFLGQYTSLAFPGGLSLELAGFTPMKVTWNVTNNSENYTYVEIDRKQGPEPWKHVTTGFNRPTPNLPQPLIGAGLFEDTQPYVAASNLPTLYRIRPWKVGAYGPWYDLAITQACPSASFQELIPEVNESGSYQVRLRWSPISFLTAPSDAGGFHLIRSYNTIDWVNITPIYLTVNDTSMTDSPGTLQPSTEYTYAIEAYRNYGGTLERRSAFTEITIKTPPTRSLASRLWPNLQFRWN